MQIPRFARNDKLLYPDPSLRSCGGRRTEKPFIATSAPEGVIEEMAYGSPEGEP